MLVAGYQDYLSFEDGTDRLFQNVGIQPPIRRATFRKQENLNYNAAETCIWEIRLFANMTCRTKDEKRR
jgi:hypothetical protein